MIVSMPSRIQPNSCVGSFLKAWSGQTVLGAFHQCEQADEYLQNVQIAILITPFNLRILSEPPKPL